MATTIRGLMTPDPVVLPTTESVRTAAQRMRDDDIGAVLIEENGTLRGLVSDRDIVTRAVAEGQDADSVTVSDVCSSDLHVVGIDDDVATAIEIMREHAVRRIPVVENGSPVGVLSLGDLARAEDPRSALADISAAPPND